MSFKMINKYVYQHVEINEKSWGEGIILTALNKEIAMRDI